MFTAKITNTNAHAQMAASCVYCSREKLGSEGASLFILEKRGFKEAK